MGGASSRVFMSDVHNPQWGERAAGSARQSYRRSRGLSGRTSIPARPGAHLREMRVRDVGMERLLGMVEARELAA